MGKLLKVGNEVFEEVSDDARLTVEFLVKTHEKLGEPNDLNETGLAFLRVLYKVWARMFPEELIGRESDQRHDFLVERTVQQATAKDGGYFVASFPPRFFYLFSIFFPEVKITDRKNSQIITREFPIFKGTQYKI